VRSHLGKNTYVENVAKMQSLLRKVKNVLFYWQGNLMLKHFCLMKQFLKTMP